MIKKCLKELQGVLTKGKAYNVLQTQEPDAYIVMTDKGIPMKITKSYFDSKEYVQPVESVLTYNESILLINTLYKLLVGVDNYITLEAKKRMILKQIKGD